MKKLFFIFCLSCMISCVKEDPTQNTEYNIQKEELNIHTNDLNIQTKTSSSWTKYDDVARERTSQETNVTCTVDPDDFEECEVTFKVLCIDDCGLDLMENGEVWITFEYYTFEPANPSNTAYVKNNWGSIAGGGANLQIGQEYTLQHPVIVSESCPILIWGEMWSCCFACIPPCDFGDLDLVAGTIYLEINGAVYYPLPIWNLPHCTILPAADPWPTPIEHFFTSTLDDNCRASGRVDYVQDPCGTSSF